MGLWNKFTGMTGSNPGDELDELDEDTTGFPRQRDEYKKYADAPATAPASEPRKSRGLFGGLVSELGTIMRGEEASASAPVADRRVSSTPGVNRGRAVSAPKTSASSAVNRPIFTVMKPSTLEEMSEVALAIDGSKPPILLSLEHVASDTRTRQLDFISGAAFIVGGKVIRINNNTFIVTAQGQDINLEAIYALSGR